VKNDVETMVSKYVSYLLRHNPEDLEMDKKGFVELDDLISKARRRFPTMDKKLLMKIAEKNERKRFEIVGNKIRALYGHTIPVHMISKKTSKLRGFTTGQPLKLPKRFWKRICNQ